MFRRELAKFFVLASFLAGFWVFCAAVTGGLPLAEALVCLAACGFGVQVFAAWGARTAKERLRRAAYGGSQKPRAARPGRPLPAPVPVCAPHRAA